MNGRTVWTAAVPVALLTGLVNYGVHRAMAVPAGHPPRPGAVSFVSHSAPGGPSRCNGTGCCTATGETLALIDVGQPGVGHPGGVQLASAVQPADDEPTPLPLEPAGELALPLPPLPEETGEAGPRALADEPRPAGPVPRIASIPARPNPVSTVIDEELPGASREEREIWYEQFKSFPAEVVRDMLRVRGELGAAQRLPADAGNAQPPVGVDFDYNDLNPAGEAEAQRTAELLEATCADLRTLRRAQAVIRHNLSQAQTPGYRRLIPVLSDVGYDDEPAAGALPAGVSGQLGQSIKLVGTKIDAGNGEFHLTERDLDVAIRGEGWFIVRHKGETHYTRCGSLARDENGQLCVHLGARLLPLQPAVQLPDRWIRVVIEETGEVKAVQKLDEEPVLCGRIELARCPCPEHFAPKGDRLYQPNPLCGPLQVGRPGEDGLGQLCQERLEASNVDLEAEMEQHDRFEHQIGALRSAWEQTISRMPLPPIDQPPQ